MKDSFDFHKIHKKDYLNNSQAYFLNLCLLEVRLKN